MFFTLTLGDSYFPFLAYSCFPITPSARYHSGHRAEGICAGRTLKCGVSVLLSLFQVVLGIAVLIGIVIGIIKFIDRKNPSSPKVTDDTAKTSPEAIKD